MQLVHEFEFLLVKKYQNKKKEKNIAIIPFTNEQVSKQELNFERSV